MTRKSLNRTIHRVYLTLGLVLVIALAAKLAGVVPGLAQPFVDVAARLYEFIKEMAPLLIAVLATYLASAFQKRSKFTSGLEQEWRGIVSTKNALYVVNCHAPSRIRTTCQSGHKERIDMHA